MNCASSATRHQQVAFEELKRAIHQIEERIRTLDQAIEDAVKPWRFAAVVDASRALRGVNTTIAATLAAEIGDIARFANPRQLMAWLGLVPSEHSSGSTTGRGRITRTGNALARTMMVEASWSYRHPPRERHLHLKRSQHLPQEIRTSAGRHKQGFASVTETSRRRENRSRVF